MALPSQTDPHPEPSHRPTSFWRSSTGRWALLTLAVAAIFFGWEYRTALFSSALIVWLPLVLCVGMHFFMHRGHGSHHGRGLDEDR